MSQSKLSQVDIKKLTVEYMWTTHRIKIVERDVNVKPRSPIAELELFYEKNPKRNEKQVTSKVTFVNHKATALAQVFTKVLERKNFCRITLKHLVIKGLLDGKTIRLPLNISELRREFGEHIEIDTSQSPSEQKHPKSTDLTSSVYEQIMTQERQTAQFTCRKKEAKYRFQYRIVMDGLVTIPSHPRVGQCSVAEIIKVMKKQYTCLRNVEVDEDKFEFPLSGTVEFRWDCHENVTWV